MTQLKQCVWLAVLAAVLPIASFAQTQEGAAGQQATATAPAPASAEEPQLPGRETYEADTTPLSASQLFGLGFSGESLNVLNIGLSAHQQFDSNIFASGTNTDFRSVTSFMGNLDLNRMWKRNSLDLHYTGGGSIYSDSSVNNQFHSVGIMQSLSWKRWTLRLGDEFLYSPYSPYSIGMGGYGYANSYGWGNQVLHPGEVPDMSIYSTRSSRILNTVLTNLDYSFTRRTALTFSGSYGILNYQEPLFFDSKQYGGGVGLSHQLTGHDSISGNYRFSRNQFDVLGTSFETHTMEFRYGRRIPGRLGLELWGGPQINYYDSGPATQRDVIGSAGGNVRYRTRTTDYWVEYNRGVRGGSGVLLGSVADVFSVGISRGFGRNWSMSLNGGYSHNRGIVTTSQFNNGYGGIFLRRALGQYAGIGFNYAIHRQTGNCVSGNCPAFTRQIVGVSFDWHMKPIRLE